MILSRTSSISEDQFYQDGYKEGMADGEKAGRIEGRSFGLEKGFEKFCESGRLYGRSIVWANRLPEKLKDKASHPESQETSTDASEQSHLPPLPKNPRLAKNIATLYALVELESLSRRTPMRLSTISTTD